MHTLYLLDHTEKNLLGAEIADLRCKFGDDVRFVPLSRGAYDRRIKKLGSGSVLFPRDRFPVIPETKMFRDVDHFQFTYPPESSRRELTQIWAIRVERRSAFPQEVAS
jgi:hypothetical protein